MNSIASVEPSTKPQVSQPPLSPEELRKMHAYWRAANYLSVGQIYLYANPLLREPLSIEHVKPRLLGHWGTTPGLNFIYVHLNRLIKKYDLNVIYICGPGHGGPGFAETVQAVLLSRWDSESRGSGDARVNS
jgi:xylulose-5-phosphate/fructose-6-phosphate phosphoketolase